MSAKKDIEEELVEHLLSMDGKRFTRLFDHYSGSLLGIIYQIVKDEHQAQDILQDVFLKIWNHASTYDAGKSRLFTWMLNIARNTSIDYLRSSQGQAARKSQPLDARQLSISTPGQHEYMGLKKIVAELRDDQREIIDLAFFEGYTHSEIAEKLSLPLGTVKTKCRSAISALRKSMQISES